MESILTLFEDGSLRLLDRFSVCALPWKGCSIGYAEIVAALWLAAALWLVLGVDQNHLSWRQAWGWLLVLTFAIATVLVLVVLTLDPNLQVAAILGLGLGYGLGFYLVFGD